MHIGRRRMIMATRTKSLPIVGLEAEDAQTIPELLPFLVESPSRADVHHGNWIITEYSGIRYEMTRHQRLGVQANGHVRNRSARRKGFALA